MKKIVFTYIFCLFLVWTYTSSNATTLMKRSSHIEIVSQNPIVEVVAYPNPFKDGVSLEIVAVNCKPTVLKIYDIIGVEKLVIDLEDFAGSGHYKLQIKDLAEGIYFCNIYSHNKLLDSKKLVCSK
ncbi:MAG: T9SS type A sorting domain-containing protein [Cytophagales bacterium]